MSHKSGKQVRRLRKKSTLIGRGRGASDSRRAVLDRHEGVNADAVEAAQAGRPSKRRAMSRASHARHPDAGRVEAWNRSRVRDAGSTC